jgi:hypothetical protein
MKKNTLSLIIATALLSLVVGWLLRGVVSPSTTQKTEKGQDSTTSISQPAPTTNKTAHLSGRYLLAESNCAGFQFIGDNKALWTNEMACNEPDTLKLYWYSETMFMTKSTKIINESCPPIVDVYTIIADDGKQLTLKAMPTGWVDGEGQTMQFTKQSN